MIRGYYVWYYVPPDAEHSYVDLNAALKKHGAPIRAFRKPNLGHVLRRVMKELSEVDLGTGLKVKKGPSDKHMVLYELIDIEGMVTRVAMDKKSFELFFEYPEDGDDENNYSLPDVENFVRSRLEEWREVIHDQPIRESLRKTIEDTLDGTPMKSSGGIYFVPASHKKELDAITSFISEVGGDYLTVVSAHDDGDKEIQKALAARLTDTLYLEAANLVREIQDLSERGGLVMASTILDAEKTIQTCLDKVEEYCKMDSTYEDFFSSDGGLKTQLGKLLEELSNI